MVTVTVTKVIDCHTIPLFSFEDDPFLGSNKTSLKLIFTLTAVAVTADLCTTKVGQ